MKVIIEFFLGRRVNGERLPEPTEKIIYPEETLPFNEWCKSLNVGVFSDPKIF